MFQQNETVLNETSTSRFVVYLSYMARSTGILLYVISYFTDVLSLMIIYKCRRQLKIIELLILFSCQLLVFSHKMLTIIVYVAIYFDWYMMGARTCITLYPLFMAIATSFYFVLIYYAMCHYSTIRRSGHCLKLFYITQRVRNFIIYLVVTVAFSFVSKMTIFHLNSLNLIEETTAGRCSVNVKDSSAIALVSMMNVPLFCVQIIYVTSIVRIMLSLKYIQVMSVMERYRYRRAFRVSVKFLTFACLPLFWSLIRVCIVSLASFCPQCRRNVTDLLQFLNALIFIIEPSVLIYVHNVLKKQFFKLFFSS